MGVRTQPCFTPLLTMVRFVSSRNDFTMPRSVGGQPALARIRKRPSLLIMSKALVSEVYEGLWRRCTMAFSAPCTFPVVAWKKTYVDNGPLCTEPHATPGRLSARTWSPDLKVSPRCYGGVCCDSCCDHLCRLRFSQACHLPVPFLLHWQKISCISPMRVSLAHMRLQRGWYIFFGVFQWQEHPLLRWQILDLWKQRHF